MQNHCKMHYCFPLIKYPCCKAYLQKHHLNLTLNKRIAIIGYLCAALYHIHNRDLIHCDLHSGNMLVQGGGCFITDLGLCGPVDDESSNKIC